MFRHGRHRQRIAFAVMLCLLLQQAAMAAYACSLPRMPSNPVAMAAACAEMEMDTAQPAPPATLCARHCSPEHVANTDPVAPQVPPLALPPLQFAAVLLPADTHVASIADVPVNRSDPPPRLRYCSLLI